MSLQESGLIEATVAQIAAAYATREISAVDVTRAYIERIRAFDSAGPRINSIIKLNPSAVDDAAALDRELRDAGPRGVLHGIPVIVKDQIDVRGLATTLGSVAFKDHDPRRDACVVTRLRKAGAVILAKATLGELGGGDTHGSLFGSTKNPYALDRTAGGSSGGTAASVAASFASAGLGQEGFASIRRPAAWCSIVGMRPTAGLVSRTGVYAGWPARSGSVGPMARTVRDAAMVLDAIVGYDPADPLTAHGVGNTPASFVNILDGATLDGARLGVLRQVMGRGSEPASADFKLVDEVFDSAVDEIRRGGARVVDPLVIPGLEELLARRAGEGGDADESWHHYFGNTVPYISRGEFMRSRGSDLLFRRRIASESPSQMAQLEYVRAREALMTATLRVMAESGVDAIVHKTVEHQPGLLAHATAPSHVDGRGATHLNTFLIYVPAITVPAGFTRHGLPVGITFLGRPYTDAAILGLAYAYEGQTGHRRPPASTPAVGLDDVTKPDRVKAEPF